MGSREEVRGCGRRASGEITWSGEMSGARVQRGVCDGAPSLTLEIFEWSKRWDGRATDVTG